MSAARASRLAVYGDVAALIYILIATWTPSVYLFGTGVDPSWHIALNTLADAGTHFGPDVAFTYGPLGFLACPERVGSNLLWAMLFRVALNALLGALLWAGLRTRPGSLIPVALGFFVICAQGAEIESQLFITELAGALALYRERRLWIVASLGALASVVLLIKVTMGVMALALIVPALALHGWRRRRLDAPAWATLLATLCGGLLILGSRAFGSFSNAVVWVARAKEFAAGYSAAMSFPGPTYALVLTGVAFAVFAAWIVWLGVSEPAKAWLCASLAPALFLSFKRGFIRQDGGHMLSFFIALAAIALLVQLGAERRALRVAGIGLAVALLLSASYLPGCRLPWTSEFWEDAVGYGGYRWMRRTVHNLGPAEPTDSLGLQVNHLPPEWVATLKKANAPIGVMPYDLSVDAANGLPWEPQPSLQSYAAYTRVLDAADAEYYRSKRAPPYLLVTFDGIDYRNVFTDVPATWEAIMAGYDYEGKTRDDRFMLLERRASPLPLERQVIGEADGQVGEWLEVPKDDGMVAAEIPLALNWRGRFHNAFYYVPFLLFEVELTNGEQAHYRVIADTLANGVVVSHLPRSTLEMATLLRREPLPRVARFRLAGPAIQDYGPRFHVTYRKTFTLQERAVDAQE